MVQDLEESSGQVGSLIFPILLCLFRKPEIHESVFMWLEKAFVLLEDL